MVPALIWLLTVQGLGLAVLPLTVRVFRGLPDRGLGLARVVGLVVIGWLAYLTAMLGFTAYLGGTVAVLALLVGGAAWGAWWRPTLRVVRERLTLIAAGELTFLLVFGVGAFVRAHNPDIVGQEKFMDYAFMHALLRTSVLPAEDMWLSGFAMPYYYLGYLLLGLPAKIASTPGPMAYNLAVVFVFASGFGAAVSIVYALVAAARTRTAGERAAADGRCVSPAALGFGLLGGTLTVVVGNLVGPLELLAARGLGSSGFWSAVGVRGLAPAASPSWLPADGGWWWRSSRVIPNIPPDGITEFPYFSFLLGDLHPHYMAIPFVLLIVGLAVSRWLDPEAWPDPWALALGGVALATLIPASTWDVPTFWGLYALAALGDGWRREGSREKLAARLPTVMVPAGLALLMAVPYFVGYQSQPLGLGIVWERTPVVSMLILFGPVLLVAVLFAIWLAARAGGFAEDERSDVGRVVLAAGLLVVGLSAIGEPTLALLAGVSAALAGAGWRTLAAPRRMGGPPPPATITWLIVAWAVCVLIGVELIFLRDLFGSRMNTVFKFQYHAWLLFGVGASAALGLLWRTRPAAPGWHLVSGAVAVAIVVPGLVYPLAATWTKSNGFRGEPTLMGDRFLERGAPADYRAIEWLRQNTSGRPVVVEAVGDDYSEHARVSTFSGLPTLIGWVGHELQWRGQRPELGTRQQAVDAIYRAASREEIARAAELYRVRYVFFGTLERAKYGPEARARLDRLLPVAYSRGGTTIYLVERE